MGNRSPFSNHGAEVPPQTQLASEAPRSSHVSSALPGCSYGSQAVGRRRRSKIFTEKTLAGFILNDQTQLRAKTPVLPDPYEFAQFLTEKSTKRHSIAHKFNTMKIKTQATQNFNEKQLESAVAGWPTRNRLKPVFGGTGARFYSEIPEVQVTKAEEMTLAGEMTL